MKRSWLIALALSASFTGSAFAQIEGTVTFDGKAPDRKPLAGIGGDPNCGKLHAKAPLDESVIVGAKGELANAVVFLKGDLKGDVPQDEVVLDQQACVYTPHVVSVTVGQKLVALNSDPFLHNVHTLPELNQPMNRGQAVKGQKDPISTKAAEIFKVKCDVHPWMSAWVAVFDHPFHSVTGEDGIFVIDTQGLKDGDYDVVVWHEKFKESATGKVTVKDGKGKIDLKVTPKQAAAPAAGEREVALTSATNKPTCCSDGSKCAETAAKAKAAEQAKAEKK